MKTISISELHARTGHYVRLAATEQITVTDRGKPIAILESALGAKSTGKPFPKRDSSTLPTTGSDSTVMISENRDDRR